MRLVEFAPTDKSDSGDVYSNVVTALSLLQNQILDNDLPAEVPTNIRSEEHTSELQSH